MQSISEEPMDKRPPPFFVPGSDRDFARRILEEICDSHGLTASEVISPCKQEDVVLVRHLAMTLIHTLAVRRYGAVGLIFERHHGTVMYAVKRIKERCDVDPDVKARFEQWVSYFKRDRPRGDKTANRERGVAA